MSAPFRTGRHLQMRPVVRPVPRPAGMSGVSAAW
jgi:hypothetical protein